MDKELKRSFLVDLEEKVLKFWNEQNIFEKVLQRTQRSQPFIFYEGPPTANGLPHIGHAETRAFKDIILRYKTMRGFWVMRKAGWDTHGLPVELEVEKRLGLKSKTDIENFGIAKFNQACRESVWKYKAEWEHFSKRIGFWIDFNDPYITYDNSYMESLWWIIKEFWRKGYLYEDYKVVPWCPRCGTPLASHELAQDDGYKSVTEESVYVKFKIKSDSWKTKNSYFLAWTTTPWTLPGNVALAVGENITYALVRVYREHYVLAKSLIEAVFGKSLLIIKEFKGRELIGLRYEPLYKGLESSQPKNIENAFQVLPASFASEEDGTGIVHTAVMYGEDDFHLGKKFKLPQHHTVDLQGKFLENTPEFRGRFVKDADPDIIRDLERRDLLLKSKTVTHDYPFCWRCKSPLIYYARQAWWVKRKELKKELLAANSKINWVPQHLRDGRFGEWLKDIKDWAFSRERYWGTPLPVWKCQSCKHVEVIGGLEELKKFSPTSKNKYWILRHGQSETNIFGLASSWPEKGMFHLTEKGREQIKRVIPKLKKAKIDFIFSSDLLRTKETDKILQDGLELEVVFSKELRELDLGEFSGRPIEDYEAFMKGKDRFVTVPLDGESWNHLRSRVVQFVKSLEDKFQGKNILLVSHGDPLWMLEASLQGLSDQEIIKHRYINPGELRELKFTPLPLNEKGELDMHRPYIDEISLRCSKCKNVMSRVKEVADVWFDSGGMPFAQFNFPNSFKGKNKPIVNGRKLVSLPYPADFITEAIDQTRGWFNSLLNVSVLLGKSAPYKNVISFGHVLDASGKKMSKHLGNVVEPMAVMEEYGADILRWYFFTVNQPEDPKRFKEEDLQSIQRGFFMILWNILQFLELYSVKPTSGTRDLKLSLLDQWIDLRLKNVTEIMTKFLDSYDIINSARVLQSFVVEDVSQWWLRRSRKRFQQPENEVDLASATDLLVRLLSGVAQLISPFAPFMAESIWVRLKPWMDKPEMSVHLTSWPKIVHVNNVVLEKRMQWARASVSKGLALRQESKIKVRQPLNTLRIKGEKFKGIEGYLVLIQEEMNVKEVMVDPRLKEEFFLDTVVTPALRLEGVVREIVRTIQEMRRDASMKPDDEAELFLQGRVVVDLKDREQFFIKRSARLKNILFHSSGSFLIVRELDIDGEKVILSLRRI